MRFDCRSRQPRAFVRASVLAAVVMVSTAALPVVAFAAPQHEAAAAGETEAPHGQTLLQSIAKVINFAILGGVLVYFLKTPAQTYLASRETQIRQDLVTASEMRATASAQLVEIDRKLKALPGELEALKVQGAEDVKAEQVRIAQAAAAERERLIAQTHREIETRLRMARRQLTEHAAELAVQVAEERIKRSITTDDQLRLVDRYAAQLKEAR
jgi:F-type H+-transporting ATPase subunit b